MNFNENMFEKFKFNIEEINTDEYISLKEEEINYKLSEKYIEFMKKCNGGFGDIGEGYIVISLPSDDLSYDNPKKYSNTFVEMFIELYGGKQCEV